jgi:hypothetical protein
MDHGSVHVDHYRQLGGVCVDYCVAINRTDLLFGTIFDRFQQVGRLTVLLELLEPYILNDKLRYLTPVAMKAFVEHYEATEQVAAVERCILHLDTMYDLALYAPTTSRKRCGCAGNTPSHCVSLFLALCCPCLTSPAVRSMDIDNTVRLTLSHRLFSAFIHVMNNGLHDYTTPIDALLAHAIDMPVQLVRVLMRARGLGDGGPTSSQPSFPGLAEDRRAVGLKLLLYIQVRVRLDFQLALLWLLVVIDELNVLINLCVCLYPPFGLVWLL